MSSTYKIHENYIQRPLIPDVEKINAKPEICILNCNEQTLDFELKNVQPSFANALRRILLSEVPTIAIDRVLMEYNTSVIPDEILASRIGLIPIRVDPSRFTFHTGGETEEIPESTLIFTLKVKCRKTGKDQPTGTTDFTLVDTNVLSSHLKWVPIGNQASMFADSPPTPVYSDILIAKLNPGQVKLSIIKEIDLTIHCRKGIGSDHAKFSPVATAFYRNKPYVHLKEPIYDDDARLLKKLFADGVIDLIQIDTHKVQAAVNPNVNEAKCINVALNDKLKDKVDIGRLQNHFIFKIESSGCVTPRYLIKEALRILIGKCDTFSSLNDTN